MRSADSLLRAAAVLALWREGNLLMPERRARSESPKHSDRKGAEQRRKLWLSCPMKPSASAVEAGHSPPSSDPAREGGATRQRTDTLSDAALSRLIDATADLVEGVVPDEIIEADFERWEGAEPADDAD